MMDAVHRYEGYVAQSTGDGIFALFGAPVATRIIRSAHCMPRCRMQEELQALRRQVCASEGKPPIEVRVGVNTRRSGGARSIKTGDGHSEYTPIGHSASLASRLQTARGAGLDGDRARATQKLVRRLLPIQGARRQQDQRASASRSTFTR